ncbi:MAG: mercuric transport protein MerTP [Bacteroidetes bacterium]|nr:MAG: mercuric transport protein MerTP [Bacteroidota bacterium]
MKNKASSEKWAGAGLLSAIAASLCCITPVLALIAGSSGLASTFSWLEPARPWLMGVTVLVLGFAWYQKLRPQTAEIDCDCEEDGKVPFMQTKTFLGIVTVFAGLMLAFPYYAKVFYPNNEKQVIVVSEANVETAAFDIEGMTCSACEEHVKHAVNELPGIVEVNASFKEGKARVRFDKTQTDPEAIKAAIDKTGYTVTRYQLATN